MAQQDNRTPGQFRVLIPGRLPYRSALQLQEALVRLRTADNCDTLLLLEHEPVVTLGARARRDHVLVSAPELRSRGIELVQTRRGGDVTFHGPGQLVGYPIVDLEPRGRDLHRYLRQIEEVLIETLAAFGILASRCAGKTGVWVGDRKIASIGIAVRHWVAWHGFALNVAADLEGFSTIVPCGLHGVSLTSLEQEMGYPIAIHEVAMQVIPAFSRIFASTYTDDHGHKV